jgi:hypothetical protein
MLHLKNPKDHFVGAMLDENGNAVKVVCDLLVAGAYVIDTKTSPMTSLVVTFDRADEVEAPPEATHLPTLPPPVESSLLRAGPMTQHMISGLELATILEGGITIEAIEESVLRTGIPSANIAAEDLELYEAGFRVKELVAGIKSRVAKLEAQRLEPVPIPGQNA